MRSLMILVAAAAAVPFAGRLGVPRVTQPAERPVAVVIRVADLDADVQEAISDAKKTDPGVHKFFEEAEGYAVFPGITKGGIGIGAAHGDGEVFQHGVMIGRCSMTQVNIGAQLGGQQYREIIFFQTKDALESFKSGSFAFDAQASAVALASGASANAKYRNGVVVFTQAKGGLMYEATVGGQKFGFKPKSAS
jgi:lipid-binding SYLF domain-containing protein